MTAPPPGDFTATHGPEGLVVALRGTWRMADVAELESRLRSLEVPAGAAVRLDGSGLGAVDTVGVWVIRALRNRLTEAGHAVQVVGLPDETARLYGLVDQRMHGFADVPKPAPEHFLERVGRGTWRQLQDLGVLVAFVGETAIAFGRQLLQPRRVRWRQTAKIVEESGLNAIPIIGLLVFLLGVVVAYQGGRQLRIYGANIFIVEMVGLITLRELAPLIAAIIVAGRTGSAYTAEIGTMRVTEEIDALRTLGISPFDQLVLPKLFGLMVSLPLLTVFADAMGVIGGMVMATSVLDVSFTDFLERMPRVVSTSDFVVGVVKAPFFAAIIALVGCHQGFQVSGGADSVGRQTTVSVVQSIFLVILTDAFFSILFSWMGV